MIIRCDQCKTRFRLDDSKVTVSGVRVRCSKCKHTFVVRKDADDVESATEDKFPETEDTAAETCKQDNDTIGADNDQAENGQRSDEFNLPYEPVTASAQDSSTESVSDKSSSIEDDFLLFKSGRPDSDPVPPADEPEEEKSPFQWSVGQETEEQQDRKDDDFQIASEADAEEKETISRGLEDLSGNAREGDYLADETIEAATTESSYQIQPPAQDLDQSLEGLSSDYAPTAKVHDSGGTDDFSLGDTRNWEKDDQLLIEKDQPAIVADAGTIDKPQDFPDVQDGRLTEAKERETVPFSFETGAGSKLHPHESDVCAEKDLPPLSISSRRKRTVSLTKIFTGLLTIMLLMGIAGTFLFRTNIASINIPSFSTVKNHLMAGQWKNGEIVIKNLDGTFVHNNHGVDIFVIRGEAFNQSDKSSATVRIQGYIYGGKGEVLLDRLACFGQVLSNDQLAALPVNEIGALSGSKPGNIPRDLIMSPGKRTPFQIIFLHVPEEAGEFGAEVVDSAAKIP